MELPVSRPVVDRLRDNFKAQAIFEAQADWAYVENRNICQDVFEPYKIKIDKAISREEFDVQIEMNIEPLGDSYKIVMRLEYIDKATYRQTVPLKLNKKQYAFLKQTLYDFSAEIGLPVSASVE